MIYLSEYVIQDTNDGGVRVTNKVTGYTREIKKDRLQVLIEEELKSDLALSEESK